MTVTFRDVDRENFYRCVKLDVRDDQRGFVATNVFSIAQSKVEPTYITKVVYDGDEMVGFVMYGFEPDDGRHYLGRLMIDKRHQGKGYGRAATVEVIERLRREPECREVFLWVNVKNEGARKLYESLGFEGTGEMHENEHEELMRLKLDESCAPSRAPEESA
ncbi:MAG TPA: GNAT family N-acetyltransferase [Pyrinomonadaceae bacterium]|nr:GNAT family N-acetyltransferase [Pyrinomonadaceae bacterium]